MMQIEANGQLCRCPELADTVEKLTKHARFTFLEDDSYYSFRVIGSVVTANYGWRLKK